MPTLRHTWTGGTLLTITAKSVGSRKPLFADWHIPLTPEWGDRDDLTLRHLIEKLVRIEVASFNQRQDQRRLDRVLSPTDLAQGERTGRIAPEGRNTKKADANPAVAAALEAFEDGMYLVFIDDQEQHSLDQPVRLSPDSRILFLRLTFLAGA